MMCTSQFEYLLLTFMISTLIMLAAMAVLNQQNSLFSNAAMAQEYDIL